LRQLAHRAIACSMGLILIGCSPSEPVIEQTQATTDAANTDAHTASNGAPPLIEATLNGQTDTVRSLLRSGADTNAVYRTNTALTYAARDGFLDIARLLIDAGADVNWIDGEGVTPLILASFKDHEAIVRLLLDHGADPTIQDQWNRTALDYALRRGDDDPIAQRLQTVSLDNSNPR